MKRSQSNVRQSFIPRLSSIARDNHKHLTNLEHNLERLRREISKTRDKPTKLTLEEQIKIVESELAKTSMIVIVFTAMTIEAYIYDYAARHLGDAFTKDHLDKLDPVSKWIIIPELVTGREMPLREGWYARLKKLIKIRNSITHHKSSDPTGTLHNTGKNLKRVESETGFIYTNAKQSVNLLAALADKIIEMDPAETLWVKSYLA